LAFGHGLWGPPRHHRVATAQILVCALYN
jgi:hypothetical protein